MAAMVTTGGSLSGCAVPPRCNESLMAQNSRNHASGSRCVSMEESHSMVLPPNTLLELLSNLKTALNQDLLLQKSFYTEDNLEHFSGGHKVIWIEDSQKRQAAGIIGFDGMLKPVRVGNNTFEGISFSIGRRIMTSGKTEATAGVSFMVSNPDVTFEHIEGIFGKDWQSFPFFPLPYGRIFGKPTHPHGNDRIRYVLNGKHADRSIVIDFHEDGTVYNAEFSEETK